MGFENSLAGKMFGTIAESFEGLAKSISSEDDAPPEPYPNIEQRDNAVAADLDARAQRGEITFDDFLTISKSFTQIDQMGGMGAVLPGKLTDAEIADTRMKIGKLGRAPLARSA